MGFLLYLFWNWIKNWTRVVNRDRKKKKGGNELTIFESRFISFYMKEDGNISKYMPNRINSIINSMHKIYNWMDDGRSFIVVSFSQDNDLTRFGCFSAGSIDE
jgi:hypothetical protein